MNVREKPDKKSKVVGRLVYEEGMLPDTAECLGKVEGWYKVKTYKGKIGYIRGDLIEWTAVCTF